LSYGQQQVWLHAQLAPGFPLYNEAVTIHKLGPLNVPAFERAFNEVVRRHEAWRTAIDVIDGQPVQIVHPPPVISLPLTDLRHLPADARTEEALRIATEEARRPLDMGRVPLFRATLIRLDDEEHRLFLTLSHIIFDGVALYRVFLPELAALYEAFSAGRASPLPELPMQYGDYAEWQRQAMHAASFGEHMAYWKQQLAGDLPVLRLPADRARPAVQSFRGAMHPFVLSQQLAAAIKTMSRQEGVTLFMALLAAFAVVLHRYSGQEDILIGTATAGRKRPEFNTLLGYFLNTVVLRLDLSGDPTFRQVLARVREVTMAALIHDDVPFELLVKELRPKRELDHNPIFQVLFSLEPPLPPLDPSWRLTQMDVDTGATKYDLYLELDERPEAILARFHYSTDLFDSSTMRRMEWHWRTVIEGAVADPERRISELPLLLETERRQLAAWNATRQPYPQAAIHELFEAQAARFPDTAAVVCQDRQMTYRELNARANRLARHLRKLGVGPEVRVGLCVERSLDLVVGLLGILKAGGAYIPLDAALPKERLDLMLSDAQPHLLLTERPLLHRLARLATVVLLDAEQAAMQSESGENLSGGAGPDSLAYVIYTSGSTGVPKGVQIEHRSVVNLLMSMQNEPGLCQGDVLVAVTTLSFDIAGLEIYLPLLCGARLVLADAATTRDGAKLLALLNRSGATMMQATPTTWRMLLEAGWKSTPKLKVLCGGEALNPALAQDLVERSGSVWNLYGPTETTIWSSLHRVRTQNGGAVPIGRPIANTQIYVLDRYLNPVPPGAQGEIYIGGDGLARGYLHREELTRKRFIPDPFHNPGGRIYKTGDVGRYRANGEIECLGRIDHQVKIRGFRVELGEIEAALSRHPAVKEVAAAVYEDASGEKSLVAYWIPRTEPVPAAGELRAYLKERVPEYMVPASLVVRDALPQTPNGKLDRQALPSPEKMSAGAANTCLAPRDELESQLCQIWEAILGIKPIGIEDDFFSLGGHSLLATRLFAQIEKRFGRKMFLSTLFKAPDIAHLAEVLRGEERSSAYSWLAPVQLHGTLPPLFCVHGLVGDVLFARALAQRLGPEQPLFALEGRARKGLRAHDSIEAMAADYVAEIRHVQAHGPYFLSGSCFGARVALEMAQQLLAEGEEVALLCLFLGYEPQLGYFASLASKLKWHWKDLRALGITAKVFDLLQAGRKKTASLRWRLRYNLFGSRLPDSSPLFQNITEMNLVSIEKYRPPFYPGRMTVFMNGGVPDGLALDPGRHLFGMRAGEIDFVPFPGDIGTMFEEPVINMVAEQLKIRLRGAARPATCARPEADPVQSGCEQPRCIAC